MWLNTQAQFNYADFIKQPELLVAAVRYCWESSAVCNKNFTF